MDPKKTAGIANDQLPRLDESQLQAVRDRISDSASRGLKRGRNTLVNLRLTEGIRTNNRHTVRRALQAGADPNIRVSLAKPTVSRKASPVLHEALKRQRFAIADLLIDAGADVNMLDPKTHSTPLQQMVYAGQDGADETLVKLVEKGADVNYRNDKSAKSPSFLHQLTDSCFKLNAAKCVLLHGADYTLRNKDGKTPETRLAEHEKLGEMSNASKMFWVLKLHRLAPELSLTDDTPLSRDALELKTENGFCALDHWSCWDNYSEVQEKLKEQGQPPLKGSDLLAPLGGSTHKDAPRRLDVMLGACPTLQNCLHDYDLWKNEPPQVLRQVYDALPESQRSNIPVNSLIAQISRDQNQVKGMGR